MNEDLMSAYIGNPNLLKQALKAQQTAQQRQAENLPDPKTYGFVRGLFGTPPDELGMSVLSPNTALAKEAAYLGGQLGNILGIMPTVEQFGMAGAAFKNSQAFQKAQEANTFSRDSFGFGFGRRMGYPQEKGTPIDKLFSNFADNIKSEKAQEKFREDMLKRASSFHSADQSKNNLSATFDFNSFLGNLETNPRTGATKLLIKDGNKTVAAAKLDKGMIDSIAVSSEYKGKGIGANLLRFIDETNLGNIYEVPDRSPGFIKIQKEVLKEKGIPLTSSELPLENLKYTDPFGFSLK